MRRFFRTRGELLMFVTMLVGVVVLHVALFFLGVAVREHLGPENAKLFGSGILVGWLATGLKSRK